MFIHTLPIIFTYTNLFTLYEALIFCAAIFLLTFLYTHEVDRHWQDKELGNWYHFLHSAWLGKLSLWRAFWPFFVLINLILFYIDYRISNVSYTIASWKTVHGMALFPILWWIVSVWRCSRYCRYKIWAAAARTVTVYLILELCLRFFIATQYPHTLFDCRLLVMEYGDCL